MRRALAGYNLIILEDDDESGRKIAANAAKVLSSLAKSVRVVPFAHLYQHLEKKPSSLLDIGNSTADVSDWLEWGGNASKLIEICREVPAAGAVSAAPHDFPDESSLAPWDFLYGRASAQRHCVVHCSLGWDWQEHPVNCRGAGHDHWQAAAGVATAKAAQGAADQSGGRPRHDQQAHSSSNEAPQTDAGRGLVAGCSSRPRGRSS